MAQARKRGLLGSLILAFSLAVSQATEAAASNEPTPATPTTEGTEAQAAEPLPPGLRNGGDAFATPMLEDPAFDSLFSGVIRVLHGEEVLFETARGIDRNGQPLTADSVFWLASISKVFAATALLQLVGSGQAALHDPVGRHIASWPDDALSKGGQVCTIEYLLSHQCGLPRQLPFTNRAVVDPVRRPAAKRAFLSELASIDLNAAPGTAYEYTNVGYNLVALLVMEIAERSYDGFLQEQLFEPIGLRWSGADPTRLPDLSDRVAPFAFDIPWMRLDSERWLGIPWDAPSLVGASGSAFSTPAELGRWFRALMQGRLLPPDVLQQMITPRRNDYGLGIQVHDRGFTRIAHNGALEPHGFNTYVAHVPQWDVTVVVLTNRSMASCSATGLGKELLWLLADKEYDSRFPSGTVSRLAAGLMGILYLLFPLWCALWLITAPLRRIKTDVTSWAVTMLVYGWLAFFLRGQLGIFSDDLNPTGLWLATALCLGAVVHTGLRRNPDLPLFPPLRPVWVALWRWAWTGFYAFIFFVSTAGGLLAWQTVTLVSVVVAAAAFSRREGSRRPGDTLPSNPA